MKNDDGIVGGARKRFIVEIGDKRWVADNAHAVDLSLPLSFDDRQPTFFGAAPASAATLQAGSFIGDVQRGGSCNCSSYTLTPHCNGTHTECVGHITQQRISVRSVAQQHLVPALLLSIEPVAAERTSEGSALVAQSGDRLVTREALQQAARALAFAGCEALIVRTLPNDGSKALRDYDAEPAPYFSAPAMHWIVELGIRHLVVDLPSLDRGNDAGRLTAHRIFWGLPAGSADAAAVGRADCTVTELAYVPPAVADGAYLLNLQVAPFEADAAPSRPVIYPLRPQRASAD